MKKNLIVKQDGYKECGAACLLSIIHFYHGNISINRLVELTQTDKNGTNFYNLKIAAEQIGIEVMGFKVEDIFSLLEIKKPFICQLIDHQYEHFVVVYEIKKHKVLMMDPNIGFRKLSIEEMKQLWTGYIMIFNPKKKLANYQEEKFLNKIIIETIQKNKGIVLNILLLSIIFSITSFAYALYFQIIVDFVIDTIPSNLLTITFLFSILLLIKCCASFFRNELLIYLNQKIDCSILLNTFQKILLLPYSYYKNHTTGEMISRINDLIYVKNILNKIILTVFLDIIIFLGSGIILFITNRLMFCILVLIILIYFLIFNIFRPVLKKYTDINQINNATLNSFLTESINGFETIKNIHMESIVNRRIEKLYLKSLNDSFIYEQFSNLEFFIKEITSLIGLLLVEFLGFYLVFKGSLSLGQMMTFTFLTSYFIEPIKNIIDLNKEYFYALNSIKRVNHLLDIKSENLSTKTNFVIKGNIEFHHLTFGYQEGKNILNDIHTIITKEKKVMILGNSGSGKSTILKLLLKYYPIKRDSIYLDGIDLNDYTPQDIRKQISCVSQNEILYTDTIKNNITMYRNIPDETFINVCKITCVDEFVKNLFLGYETKLEENGLNLSGGQRQRIILARMLLNTSSIILIDEGLNAVDINLERKILKNIFEQYANKTIIVVSHRLENIDLFQQILTLENGYLKEQIQYPNEALYD